MKRPYLLLPPIAALCFLVLQLQASSCATAVEDPGGGGIYPGGSAGGSGQSHAGTAGASGTSGTGGNGGTSGTSGIGGRGGSGGKGGNGGSGGKGGNGGNGGNGGSGGAGPCLGACADCVTDWQWPYFQQGDDTCDKCASDNCLSETNQVNAACSPAAVGQCDTDCGSDDTCYCHCSVGLSGGCGQALGVYYTCVRDLCESDCS